MSVGQLSVGVVLSLIDRFSPGMNQVESRLSSMSTGLAKLGTVATGAGMALGAIGDRVLEPLKQVAGAAMAFESAMADVNKVVDFDAPDGLATMSAQLDRMTHRIPLAATGLASIAAEGGQLGIAADGLTGYVEVVAKMATAFDMLPQRAGESMAKLANVYDLPIAGIGSLGDAINHLSNNSAAKASEIVDVLARVGGVAKGFGLTAVQAAALGNTFIALGKAPEVAGTAINALLLKLQAATRQSSEFRDGIEALGLTQTGVERAIARDAQGTLSDFLSRLAAVKSEARAGIMVDLFGLEYSDDMSALVGGLGQYHEALGLVGDESAYAGSMQAEFAARAATTENGMTLLSNRLASVGRTLGAVMLPPLGEAADRIGLVVTRVGDWLQAHPRFTGGLVMGAAGLGVFAAAMSPVLMGVGALAIGGAAALRGLTMLGPAAMVAGRGLQAGLMGAVGAVRALSLALFANPIGLAVLGIAGAALVIRKYWEPLSGFFSGLWSGLSEGLAPVGAAIGSALAPLAEMTQRWLAPLSGLLAPVGDWFAGAFAPVAGALAAPITALQNLWTWVINILAPVQGVGGAAESMGHRWGMAIAGMIGKAAELVGAFAGLAGRFAQIGADIVQGLINGFVARWGALKAKVSELAGGMVAAVQGVLKMHSPSRVFAEIGRYAVQGIEVGLGEREPALLGRMRETAARFAAVPLLAGALGVAAMPAQPPMASAALPAVSGANPALRIDDPASAARDARRAAWLGDARARAGVQVPSVGSLPNPALRIDDPASAARDARRAAWLGDARARAGVQVPSVGSLPLTATRGATGGPARDRRSPPGGGQVERGRAGAAAASGGGGGITVNIGPITVNGDADGGQVAQRIRQEVELALRQHRERDALARRGRMFD